MKKTLATLALSVLTLTSVSAFSADRADLARDNRGISREENLSVSSFCRDRLTVLKRAYHQAEMLSQMGNHIQSVAVLEGGLLEASARISPYYANTLTSKAIRRGISLLQKLKAAPEDKQKLRSINQFLFNYFNFIEDVSNRIDVPYFGRNIDMNNTVFEKVFTNFAKEQVNMVLASMTVTEGGIIYPIGSPDLVLTALQVTTNAMANDLSESVFASFYACSIEDLQYVSSDIKYYLQTRSTYADDFVAVQELITEVKHTVQGFRSCNGGGRRDGRDAYQPRTTELLNGHTITLESGTTEHLALRETQYIKKLIISAEGLRSDAMFDVVVNGDVKGTVYVPGRDPSYFVTIEDTADSIELVSRNGSARITKILVVAE
jgi:hypothetical protein